MPPTVPLLIGADCARTHLSAIAGARPVSGRLE